MVAANQYTVASDSTHFLHEDACRLSKLVRTQADGTTVVIDLSRASDTTTSALARLVLLRRELLKSGRDLRLTGLCDRVAGMYEINRLVSVLPAL
jgi:ABC-type transporter Mla MlaB component